MRTQGFVRKQEFLITLKKMEPFHLFFSGDHHFGARGLHSDEAFQEFIDHAKATRNAYFGLMGDPLDVLSGKEREAFSNRKIHRQTRDLLDEDFFKKIERKYIRKIEFMRGRVFFELNGNHHVLYSDGTTSDDHIAEALGAPPPGVFVHCHIVVECHGSKTKIDVLAHHGKGKGMLPVMRMQQTCPEGDIFVMGDSHDLETKKMGPIKYRTAAGFGRKRVVFLRAGSCMDGYVEDASSYVADEIYPPSDMGYGVVTCIPRRTKAEGFHVRMRSSI